MKEVERDIDGFSTIICTVCANKTLEELTFSDDFETNDYKKIK